MATFSKLAYNLPPAEAVSMVPPLDYVLTRTFERRIRKFKVLGTEMHLTVSPAPADSTYSDLWEMVHGLIARKCNTANII